MSRRKHPLSEQPNWFFVQHPVGIRAPILVTPKEGKSPRGTKQVVISHSAPCREGLVSGIRARLASVLCTSRKYGPHPWQHRFEATHRVELDVERLRQPGESYLMVGRAHFTCANQVPHPKAGQRQPKPAWWSGYGPGYSHRRWNTRYPQFKKAGSLRLTKRRVQDFVHLCDAIIGPITVLLNPDRYEGNWWETSVEEAMENGALRWYGVDNTALAHPALVSLYAGLARQCALMSRCDIADEILIVDRQDVRACLTNSDPVLALRLARKMQRWIAVPAPRGANTSNLPVPVGSFSKIPALHKAIYKHGYGRTFGRNFTAGWGVEGGPYGHRRGGRLYRGIHSFMGNQGGNGNGKRIRDLAKKAA